jgi:tetratricopeptide (TPR) repeat protein
MSRPRTIATCIGLMGFGWLPAIAQQAVPPAEFLNLEITYRFTTGSGLTEVRSGQIRFNDTKAFAMLKRVVVPKLNAAGGVKLGDLTLLRPDKPEEKIQPPIPQTGNGMVWWELSEMQPGDVVRFSVEQPVDRTGSERDWWYSDSAMIPLPVKQGSLHLNVANEFSGSTLIVDKRGKVVEQGVYTWSLNNAQPPAQAAHFVLTSFKSWDHFAAWVTSRCPSEAGEDVRNLAQEVASKIQDSAQRAEMVASTLSRRVRLRRSPDGKLKFACRPVDEVLASGAASPLEAQALFAALLRSASVPAIRALSTPVVNVEEAVNPDALSRALIRVQAEGRILWFDVERLANTDGALGLANPELAMTFGADRVSWIRPFDEKSHDPPGRVVAKLEATITSNGTLQADLALTAAGPPSRVYREAFQPGRGQGDISTLFSSFVTARRLRSRPVVGDPYRSEQEFVIRLPVREEQFILPFQSRARVRLNALPLAAQPKTLPDGKLILGSPGMFREDIVLQIPEDFSVTSDLRFDEERSFARYHSDSIVAGGRLVITRELEIKSPVVDASAKLEVETLWKAIQEDQQKQFVMRRARPADIRAWAQSIPAHELSELGTRALDQREYEASRDLFEIATSSNPKDVYSWYGLGRAMYALGRMDDARKAYEKQLELNPDDKYVQNNLAAVDRRQGFWNKAVEHLERQLKINPGDPYAVTYLPRALMQLGQWERAEAAAMVAAKAQPKNRLFQVSAAVARVCQGKSQDASKELTSALGSQPSDGWLDNAAFYLAQCGRELDLAEAYIVRALDQVESLHDRVSSGRFSTALFHQSVYSMYLDTYGWLLLRRGQTKRALEILEAASKLSPEAQVFAHLAEAENTLHHSEASVRYWRRAVFLQPGLKEQAPQDLRPMLDSDSAASIDRIWWPLFEVGDLRPSASSLESHLGYYLVVAEANGSVREARSLDPDDSTATELVPEVRTLKFAQVRVQGSPVLTFHIVKLGKLPDGRITAYRSFSEETINLGRALAPDEFPLPQQ